MNALMDPTRNKNALLVGGYSPSPDLVDRATFLPVGQYEDGSLTFAWPGFLKDAYEGAQRSYLDAARVPVPDAPSGARWSRDLDAFNAASIAPIAGVGMRAAGMADDAVRVPAATSLNALDDLPAHAGFRFADDVFTGPYHANAIAAAAAKHGNRAVNDAWDPKIGYGGDEGFVTGNGRFLTRSEAADAIKNSGLVREYVGDELHASTLMDFRKRGLWANPENASLPALGLSAVEAATKPTGIRAYHGSPHDFDRFDLSKIGTGEGAQAYGHGLYFAESEGVARSYRDNLAPAPGLASKDEAIAKILDGFTGKHKVVETPDGGGSVAEYDRLGLKRVIGSYGRRPDGTYFAGRLGDDGQSIDLLKNTSPGRMYEVRINAEPEQFLDWDKPLAEQSEAVRNALLPLAREEAERALKKRAWNNARNDAQTREMFGKEPAPREPLPSVDDYMMRMWGNEIGPGNESALREAGIPGIRYLDAASRAAGDGSRNYVVFNDQIIDILRKYGLLGTAGLGSMMLGGEDASASDSDPSTQDILQRYGLLGPGVQMANADAAYDHGHDFVDQSMVPSMIEAYPRSRGIGPWGAQDIDRQMRTEPPINIFPPEPQPKQRLIPLREQW
jgi:hypothetical protein